MKRKKHKVEQNSPEWYELRKGIFTSCDIWKLFVEPKDKGKLFSETALTLIEEKALEVINNKPTIKEMKLKAFEWGKENEPIAAIEYEHFKDTRLLDGCFWTYGENTGCSPDRLILDDGLLEIKNHENQLEHIFNLRYVKTPKDVLKYRKEYFYQCHHQLYTTDRDYCDLVSFDKRLLDSKNDNAAMVIVTIEKDSNLMQIFDEKIQAASEMRDKIVKEVLEYSL